MSNKRFALIIIAIAVMLLTLKIISVNAATDISRTKTWGAEILKYSDLNAEFDGVINYLNNNLSWLTGVSADSTEINILDGVSISTEELNRIDADSSHFLKSGSLDTAASLRILLAEIDTIRGETSIVFRQPAVVDSVWRLAGNWINTANPWADNEVADDITATSYLLLADVGDSLNNNQTITGQWTFSDSTYMDDDMLFGSDTNTGFARLGADSLAIKTGGSIRATIGSGGQVGIGAAPVATTLLHVAGSFTPAAGTGRAVDVQTTLSPAAGTNCFGVYWAPVINEAGSGTHDYLASLVIEAPDISAGPAGTTTNATTLRIVGAPTEGGTTNYALWVDAGEVRIDETLTVRDSVIRVLNDSAIVIGNTAIDAANVLGLEVGGFSANKFPFMVTDENGTDRVFSVFLSTGGYGTMTAYSEGSGSKVYLSADSSLTSYINSGNLVVGTDTTSHNLAVQSGASWSYVDAGDASWTGSSSRGIKKNIQTVTPAMSILDQVRDLDIRRYRYRTDVMEDSLYKRAIARNPNFFTKQRIGLVAEEFTPIARSLGYTGSDKSINWMYFNMAVLKTLQELADRQDALDDRISILEGR